MGSITVTMNCILSVIFLKEKLFATDVFAIFITCIGSSLFMIQAKDQPEEYSQAELFRLYTRPMSISFLACALIVAIAVYVLDHKVRA